MMEVQFKTICLNSLVEQLVSQFQSLALRQGSFVVNNVAADFYVSTDKNNLATVISSLLSSVISGGRDSCIRVSAKRFNNIILFHLQDSNSAFTKDADRDWHEVNMLAGKLGGCIIEDEVRKKHATITFSFRSLANAA